MMHAHIDNDEFIDLNYDRIVDVRVDGFLVNSIIMVVAKILALAS